MTRYESYGRREAERPVRLDRTEGVVVIEGKAYPAKEVVAALAQSGYAEIRTDGDALVLGRKKITPIFKSRQERALASLCHGSLAYCCPLSKRCAERDRALEILGLRPEDYERLKLQEHHEFLDAAKGLPPMKSMWDQRETLHPVNSPAIDTGYGSDDYRLDFDRLEETFRRRDGRQDSPRTDWRERTTTSPPGSSPFARTTGAVSQSPRSTSRPVSAGTRIKMDSPTRSSKTAPSCSLRGGETIDGIGSLFRQGELSPFSDKSKEKEDRRGFCFSCGRTIEIGTRRCPYCGAIQ